MTEPGSIRVFIGYKAPITNQQYELFDPSHKQLRYQSSPDDDSPVNHLSWYMAVMFCIWLGSGCRLPTEVEWELACRASAPTAYWWGDKFDATHCNSKESGLKRALAADPTHANAWGFMDMLGNVWEWCQDKHEAYPGNRVLRVGAYYLGRDSCRSSAHLILDPDDHDHVNGFRVARTYP